MGIVGRRIILMEIMFFQNNLSDSSYEPKTTLNHEISAFVENLINSGKTASTSTYMVLTSIYSLLVRVRNVLRHHKVK
jgi:hypothetical protein